MTVPVCLHPALRLTRTEMMPEAIQTGLRHLAICSALLFTRFGLPASLTCTPVRKVTTRCSQVLTGMDRHVSKLSSPQGMR